MILSLHNLPDLASRAKLLEENPFDILECMRDVKDDEGVILEDSPKNKYSFMDDSIPTCSNLRFSSFNCRGLLNSIEFINDIINKNKIEALAVNETFLNDRNINDVKFFDYDFVHESRKHHQHGGLGFIIRKELKSKIRRDLMIWNVEMIFETCILKCEVNKKSTIMISLYRPPSGSIDQFLMQFEILLNKISQMNKQIFIFGDFNLDLMQIQAKLNDSKVREFLELMLCQGLLPSCLILTRIDDNGATLIDNIFSNSICFSLFVRLNDISDHGVIISEFNLARSKKK